MGKKPTKKQVATFKQNQEFVEKMNAFVEAVAMCSQTAIHIRMTEDGLQIESEGKIMRGSFSTAAEMIANKAQERANIRLDDLDEQKEKQKDIMERSSLVFNSVPDDDVALDLE